MTGLINIFPCVIAHPMTCCLIQFNEMCFTEEKTVIQARCRFLGVGFQYPCEAPARDTRRVVDFGL